MVSGLHGASENDRDASDLSNEDLKAEFFNKIDSDTKERTARSYKQNFEPFFEYVERNEGHLWNDVGSQDLENFLTEEAEELAPKTASKRHAAISRFYSTLRELQLLSDNQTPPTEAFKPSNVKGLSKKTLSEVSQGEEFHYLDSDEVTELIEHVPAPELRNRAMLMLMANTGLRASEVIRVRIDKDFLDIENQKLTVLSPKKSDDNENDPTYITVYWRSEKTSDVLDTYLQFDWDTYAYADESPYLFPSKQSERLGYDQVNRIVKEAAEDAGLQNTRNETDASGHERADVTSHVLRHSYAMASLENGMSIDEIRDNLHHSDLSVTMKYLRRHEDDRRRAVMKNGPQFG